MNRRELARAITLVESARAEDQARAWDLLEPLAQAPPTARRIALSGVPGVGKSTFIEALGTTLADEGHRVAVLAVDPSSPFSGGSILGDKTRMQRLAAHPNAFIRPSPTSGTLGGVARRSYESMLLCEAAGYDIILVETVGVGQSEFEAATLSDLFCLLLLPGAGDGLQGIKRGILECADLFVVNKADTGQEERAAAARAELEAALHLTARAEPAPVRAASALTGAGLAGVWTDLDQLWSTRRQDGRLAARRASQHRAWLGRRLEELVVARFWAEHPALPDSPTDLAARIRSLIHTP